MNNDCLTPETACTAAKAVSYGYEFDDELVVVGNLLCDGVFVGISLFYHNETTLRGYDEHATIIGSKTQCFVALRVFSTQSSLTMKIKNLRFLNHHSYLPISANSAFNMEFDNVIVENSVRFAGMNDGYLSMNNSMVLNSELFIPVKVIDGLRGDKPSFARERLRMENILSINSTIHVGKYNSKQSFFSHDNPIAFDLTMNNMTFVNNSKLFIQGKGDTQEHFSTVEMTNSLFENNFLGVEVNLFELDDIFQVKLKDVIFRNNHGHIPCIHFAESFLSGVNKKEYTIINSTFEHNTALESCVVFSGSYASKIIDSIFYNNSVSEDGFFEKGSGAIKYKDSSESNSFIFNVPPFYGSLIESTVFDSNGGWFSGAVYAEGYIRLLVNHCRFTNNWAHASSALYITTSYSAIVCSTFENNTIVQTDSNSGAQMLGVLTIDGGTIAVINNTISQSNQHGMFVSDVSSLYMGGNIISHTQSGLFVDGLSMQSKITVGGSWEQFKWQDSVTHIITYEEMFNRSVFQYNRASGVVVHSFHHVDLVNMTLLENENEMGGGMHLLFDRPRQKMTLRDVHLHGNKASHYGGGLYMNFSGTPGEIRIDDDVLIHHNEAKIGGGLFIGIEELSCSVFFTADVSTNTAMYGDGIYWQKRVIQNVPGQFPSNDLQNSGPERLVVVPSNHGAGNSDNVPTPDSVVSECAHFVGEASVERARKYSCVVFLYVYDAFDNGISADFLPQSLNTFVEPDNAAHPQLVFDSPLNLKVLDKLEVQPLQTGKKPTLWELSFDINVKDDSAFTRTYRGVRPLGLDVSVLLKTTNGTNVRYVFPLALPDCPGSMSIAHEGLCVSFMSVHWWKIILPSLLLMSCFAIFIVVCISAICLCLSVTLKMRSSHLERKNQFYKSLDDDIKMLLLEREENAGLPRISINKKLFEIPFDEIKICKKLGSGGSGAVVFKSEWKGVEAAFKVFRTSSFNDSGFYDAFEKEVSILSSCRHPGIIGFYGCTLKDNKIGILMQLCSMGSLRSYMNSMSELGESPFTFETKLRILLDIAKCMSYLHRVNVVHRDLKCDNVLLDDALQPKLIDFGLSKVLDDQSNNTIRIGSRGSMAPELVRGSTYTNKVDVYSYAILMYQLLTEILDVYGTQQNIEVRVATDPNFRPIVTPEQIPNYNEVQWFIDLMKQCWRDDPDERPTFEEIVDILEVNVQRHSKDC